MTKNCVKELIQLENTSELFSGLSVEQLLLAAMIGTDIDEPQSLLDVTKRKEWKKYIKQYRKLKKK